MNVRIIEVGPRDGLQNEKTIVPSAIKAEFIQRLVQSGLSEIEVASFVSPKWVPQMADSKQICEGLDHTQAKYYALVPNLVGLENAIQSQVKHIAVFAAASESFSHKNINMDIAKSLKVFKEVIEKATHAGLSVRGYVSCVLGCPYEGAVSFNKVRDICEKLLEYGCHEISLGDTIGVGTPYRVRELIKTCAEAIPLKQLAVHFHDSFGQAIANIYAALKEGICTIDASVAGLGGCPYAKGASGNVATEEVAYLCQGLGLKTGIDLEKLIETGYFICNHLNIPNRSKVAQAFHRTQA